MDTQPITAKNRLKEVRSFIVHLRWHYQVGILSGGFLLGGFLSATMDWPSFLAQFANVHLLLFGGATAYNSYWDKDRGPVGGLKHPPPVSDWMWHVSLLLQFIGLLLASLTGELFFIIYALSVLFFILYSSPSYRWKGAPIKSFIAIGISTGINSVLLGYLAAGNLSLPVIPLCAALGVMFIILSLYPASQIYQTKADAKRGDRTFGIRYGKRGVILFFSAAFSMGSLLTAAALLVSNFWVGCIFGLIALPTGWTIREKLASLTASSSDYQKVMNLKYITSLAFVGFLVIVLLLKHLFELLL